MKSLTRNWLEKKEPRNRCNTAINDLLKHDGKAAFVRWWQVRSSAACAHYETVRKTAINHNSSDRLRIPFLGEALSDQVSNDLHTNQGHSVVCQ